MKTREELVKALRDTHGGPDGIRMCAAAADMLENDQRENGALRAEIEKLRKHNDELTEGMAQYVKDCTAKVEKITAERDAAYKILGGEPPKTCKTCDLWGKEGWSQDQVGYCEGDDHPHGPDDFCSRHRGPQKEA